MLNEPEPRTVQEYIDERPCWADGTPLSVVPLTPMQWRIWWLAAAGKFFEGMVVFMGGVALPLIVLEYGLSATDKGVMMSAALFGILIGASALGSLADQFGRKRMFIAEMALFVLFLALTPLSPNFTLLVICQFGMGLALGCDYPTAHVMISESIPSGARGRLVLAAFGFQAVGALVGTALGALVLNADHSLTAWRWMYATAIVPALAVLAARFFVTGSPHWLMNRGRIERAEKVIARLLRRHPPYPKKIKLKHRHHKHGHGHSARSSYWALFSPANRRATILASVPWFLQDLGTYGIGIFTPTILATIHGDHKPQGHNLAQVISSDLLAAKGAFVIDAFLLVGMVFAVLFVERWGRIRLQTVGFLGCAAGLFLAALSGFLSGPVATAFIFLGFIVFNFMTNLGPNTMTYLLAGEVFPTHIRGTGAGFAASFAKVGAVTTSFLFPILLKDIGTTVILFILVGTSILGAVVTRCFAIETTGVNLETMGAEPPAGVNKEPISPALKEVIGAVEPPAVEVPPAH